jgi:hypothetical protein
MEGEMWQPGLQFGWASSQLLADVQVMVRATTWSDVKYGVTLLSMKLQDGPRAVWVRLFVLYGDSSSWR